MKQDNRIRVRFAPSPTGHLHVGSARTALFNWLFARSKDGVFILRIEDTDTERSKDKYVSSIIESMEWLGLVPDEGPYFQLERKDIHHEYINRLLDEGRAYPCFCRPEELAKQREKKYQEGLQPQYSGICRNLSQKKREEYIEAGREHVIRFKVSPGNTRVEDMIKGVVDFDNETLDDFVILKSDGNPTYNFAVVIDDATMQISHVIRGDDHLTNTPKQVLIYEALGICMPKFAHIPMILGPDKARLSKRHGAQSVTEYKEKGVLQEAIINYLALLGWAYDDVQQFFTGSELIDKFTLEKVSSTPAVFDIKKLEWMNGKYIRKKTVSQLTELALPFLKQKGLTDNLPEDPKWLNRVISSIHQRIKYLSEIPYSIEYFLKKEIEYDEDSFNTLLEREDVPEILSSLADLLEGIKSFDEENIEKVFRGYADEIGLKLGKVMQPVRIALTGRSASPGIFEVVNLLGQDLSINRLRGVAKKLEEVRE